jgi:hypothetical protein
MTFYAPRKPKRCKEVDVIGSFYRAVSFLFGFLFYHFLLSIHSFADLLSEELMGIFPSYSVAAYKAAHKHMKTPGMIPSPFPAHVSYQIN